MFLLLLTLGSPLCVDTFRISIFGRWCVSQSSQISFFGIFISRDLMERRICERWNWDELEPSFIIINFYLEKWCPSIRIDSVPSETASIRMRSVILLLEADGSRSSFLLVRNWHEMAHVRINFPLEFIRVIADVIAHEIVETFVDKLRPAIECLTRHNINSRSSVSSGRCPHDGRKST